MMDQIFVLSLRTSFFHTAHPEIMENLKSKDDLLINRMSQLKIEQTGKPINPVSRNSLCAQYGGTSWINVNYFSHNK